MSEKSNKAPRFTRADALLTAIPVVIILSLYATYRVDPQFYLTWVLEESQREYQIVEFTTVVCGFLAAALLATSALRLSRDPSQRGEGLLGDRGGAKIVGIVALATFFFAGEEISWGQTYLGWETPESMKEYSVETNLHNVRTPISLQGIGSAFLLVVFVGLPLLWHLKRDKLPATWKPAIARVGISGAMVVAFLWKEYKSIYRKTSYFDSDNRSQFYVEFIDQINEHKEMLVAVALLLYGLSLWRATRDLGRDSGQDPAGEPEQ